MVRKLNFVNNNDMTNNVIRIWKERGKIMEGIKNRVFQKKDIEEIASYRMDICNSCELIDKEGKSCALIGTAPCCSTCGCCLALKTRSLSSFCDQGHWFAEVSDKEAHMIEEHIKKK